jgi:hypothetical protein
MTQRMLALPLLSLLALTRLAWGGATFSQPFVDVVPVAVPTWVPAGAPAPAVISTNSQVAVWSTTDSYVTAGSAVNVIFPPDFVVPTGLSISTCTCVFMRPTSTSAGDWGASDITFTAGSISLAGNSTQLVLPAALYPGKFYVRFDTTANFWTPANPGNSTLALVDPSGNTTLSKNFYISLSTTASPPSMGFITGTVKTTAGNAVPAALVFASSVSPAIYLPVSISARHAWVMPTGTTVDAFTAATGSDGGYSLSVPPGTYSMRAEIWNAKNGTAHGNGQDATSVVVSSGSTTRQDFSALVPLP